MSVIDHIEVMRRLTHEIQEYEDLRNSLIRQDGDLLNRLSAIDAERGEVVLNLARTNEALLSTRNRREATQHNLYQLWAAENKSAPK